MNNFPIGILDSGVGGLTIWREIIQLLPHESTIYIADSKNCPYGSRSEKEIYELSRRLVRFLLKKNVKLIVLACNTITVSCLDRLRTELGEIPIIGTVPVIKTASERSKSGKIGILSTKRTAESEYQKRLIKQFAGDCEVVNIGTDLLVPLIELGEIRGEPFKKVLRDVVEPFKKANIDTLALGCSHFPFIKKQIREVLGSKVEILDSKEAIIRQVDRVLTAKNLVSGSKNPKHQMYTTDNKEKFSIITRNLIGHSVIKDVNEVNLDNH